MAQKTYTEQEVRRAVHEARAEGRAKRTYTELEVEQIRRDAHLAGAMQQARVADHDRREQEGRRSEPRSSGSLGLALAIPGLAQQAKRIPPVETSSGAGGVTPEAQIVCTCGGGVTDLVAGELVDCVGGCGRYFTGTADKAYSFGPWADE